MKNLLEKLILEYLYKGSMDGCGLQVGCNRL